MSEFKVQLGIASQQNPCLPLAERLKQLQPGKNPYVTDSALAANSPMFFGRERELHSISAVAAVLWHLSVAQYWPGLWLGAV